MTREDIFKTVDHTLLAQTATWEEIKEICDDAIKFQTASYVKRAKDYVDGKMAICTVIGFPNGYSTTAVKEYETKDAILNGADEIDMVINLGDVKDKHFDKIKGEIALLKSACGDKISKRPLSYPCIQEQISSKHLQDSQHQEQHLTILLYLRNMLEKM